MENSVKVSVCVSVHNTSKLLPRCIDSIINQTFEDLEIVLVNNGSTDNSEAIMYDYKAKYPQRRIKVISQEDRGLAQGRQSGVNNAEGEYIAFLDADDLLLSQAIEKMYYTAINEQADIVEIQTRRDDKIISSKFVGKQNSHNVLRRLFMGDSNIPWMLWLRLYRRTLFKKPVLPKLYTNNEDNFALPCLLYNASGVYFIKEPLHEYSTDNDDSVMKRMKEDVNYASRYYNARLTALNSINHIKEYIGESVIESEYPKEFHSFMARIAVNFIFTGFVGVSCREKIKKVGEAYGISENEVVKFIEANTVYTGVTNRLIHIIGLRNTYNLRKIIHK